MSEKQYGWRDAIGVLAGHFPEGMMSEEILWCDRNGMDYEEYAHIKSHDVNPRDFDSPIAAHRAYLWSRADDPEVVEAMYAASVNGVFDGDDRMTGRQIVHRAFMAALAHIIGPRPSGEEAADE